MKRCIKWITILIGNDEWEYVVGFILAVMLGIGIGIFLYIDTIPTTTLELLLEVGAFIWCAAIFSIITYVPLTLMILSLELCIVSIYKKIKK